MSKIAWKPGTMLSPLPPVMVTCGTMENPNVLTIAWTGIVNSEPPMTYISVRPSRFSHNIIKENGEFVINVTTLELAKACDYCGVKSGKNTDKFKDMELEIEPCSQVKAPMLSKAPISLECKVKEITSFETHDMFLAEIVNVNVDDKYIEEDGRLALEKAGLLAFVHGRYYTLGRDIGAFGFSVDKTKENKTKPRKSKFNEVIESEETAEETTTEPARRSRPGFKKREDYGHRDRREATGRRGAEADRFRSKEGKERGSYRSKEGDEKGEDRRSSYRRNDKFENSDERCTSYRQREEGNSERRSSYKRKDNAENGGERRGSYRQRDDGESSKGNRYASTNRSDDRRESSRPSKERKFDGKAKFTKARRDDSAPDDNFKNRPRNNYGRSARKPE